MELLVTIIILALIFDYINGFHDAANSIATIVSTKVLTPFQAVLWAAFFNFVAFFIAKYIIGGFGIANTVSKTVVEQYITLPIILAGIIAAISWNLITWWKGIPSSSSHTLIGGFAGAAIMANGFEAIQLNIILKIAAFIFLAPFIGMVIAFGFTLLVLYICRRANPHTAEMWFKRLQLVSSAMFSVGHGLNDSQKVMGIIAAAMIAAHSMGLGMGINSISDLPDWVAFSCFTAISLGTMSGGWKIVKTMGTRITKVTHCMGTHYSCQWTPSCMYLLCSFSVPEINSASNKKGVSELFLTHLFIYTNSANLTSLPQNQHPEHCHHACYYPDQHSDLHSYQDQPVRHPEFRLERTFQHLQPGKQY